MYYELMRQVWQNTFLCKSLVQRFLQQAVMSAKNKSFSTLFGLTNLISWKIWDLRFFLNEKSSAKCFKGDIQKMKCRLVSLKSNGLRIEGWSLLIQPDLSTSTVRLNLWYSHLNSAWSPRLNCSLEIGIHGWVGLNEL